MPLSPCLILTQFSIYKKYFGVAYSTAKKYVLQSGIEERNVSSGTNCHSLAMCS